MALNKFMHERNLFKTQRPDFKALALKYDKFRQVASTDLRGSVTLDFKKPECLQALTWCLLKEHFELDVDLPLDRLIPTVPLRLNYILWLEDLLERKEHGVRGIDVGAGASCVYPLIGARKNQWHFVATESDEMNCSFAKHNVERNGLLDKIQVKKVGPRDLLEAAVAGVDPCNDEKIPRFDFCMSNPPFFASNLEAWGMTSRSDERAEPKTQSTACQSESIFPGGEVQFVRHMIADSLQLRNKIRIYTTMLGKKTSVNILKEDLRKNKVPHVATTEFCQGRTMRWGLAWTFDSTVKFPKSSKSQHKGSKAQIYKVPPTLSSCPDVPYNVQGVAKKVQDILQELKMTYKTKLQLSSKHVFTATAYTNTWSHQRRKRREKKRNRLDSSETNDVTESRNGSNTNEKHSSHLAGDTHIDDKTRVVPMQTQGVVDISNEMASHSDNATSQLNVTSSLIDPTQNRAVEDRQCNRTEISDMHKCDTKKRSLEQDSNETLDETCVKRQKLAVASSEPTESIRVVDTTSSDKADKDSSNEIINDSVDKDYLIACEISVHKEVSGIVIQMEWIEGSARDAMQQVMQFIKNRIK